MKKTSYPTPPPAAGDTGRVLIFVPKLTLEGGVANYYRMIKDFLPDNYCFFEKSQAQTLPGKLLATVYDLLRYVLLLTFKDFQLVCLNPSMQPRAVKREAVYIFITKKVFRKKLVIFWHGWQESYASEIEKHHLDWFRKRYFAADKMLVLISQVKQLLKNWGYEHPVEQVFTCFEESYAQLPDNGNSEAKPCTVLYLARVEIDKGVMIALEALKILRSQCSEPVKMIIAGSGNALEKAKKFAADNALDNVEFPGYVRGEEKIRCFQASHIFIQPSYSEGLPCAMLEAMACGLTVVTSKVGGIPDFFVEGAMGCMIDSLDPAVYAEKLAELIKDPAGLQKSGQYNREYARRHFCASQAAARECSALASVMPESTPGEILYQQEFAEHAVFLNSRRFTLLSVFLILLVSGLLAALEYAVDGMLSRDGYGYLLYTQDALADSWQAAAERFPNMAGFPPLLVMLMYAAGRLGMNYEIVGRALNLAGIVFMGWGVWFIGLELYRDKLMALCAALITVSIPKLYIDGCNILRDPLYWAEMVWACALFFRAANCSLPERKWQYWLYTTGYSLLCALSCITRKEGFFFSGLLALLILFVLPRRWHNKLTALLLLLLLCLLMVLLPGKLGVPWNQWEFIDTWGAHWQ